MMFGRYLIRIGRVTAEDVLRALDRQARMPDLTGRIAVYRGYMTADQVLEVLDHHTGANGHQFGEQAVARGYLTREQLSEIIAVQRRQRPPLGALLIQDGVLTDAQLADDLKEYFALQRVELK